MARINIEDRIKDDIRFTQDLVAKLGDYEKALGACVRAWIIAQEYWRQGRQPIPFEIWERQRLNNALIEVDLAVRQEDGIYVRGSKECFDWLFQRVQAAKRGGALSGETRRNKINDLERSKTKQNEANASKTNLHTHTQLQVQVHNQDLLQIHTQDSIHVKKPAVIHWLGDLWNAGRGSLPEVKSTDGRLPVINKRLKENSDQEYWKAVIKKIAASDFCNGRRNGSDWRATFDWLIGVDKKKLPNHLKVAEGNYDNRAAAPRSKHERDNSGLDAEMERMQREFMEEINGRK